MIAVYQTLQELALGFLLQLVLPKGFFTVLDLPLTISDPLFCLCCKIWDIIHVKLFMRRQYTLRLCCLHGFDPFGLKFLLFFCSSLLSVSISYFLSSYLFHLQFKETLWSSALGIVNFNITS